MKKLIIGALVGGLIVFIWSFLSWAGIGIHKSQTAHTENQEEIMAFLEGKLSEGSYFLPQASPDASSEEYEAYAESMSGKPWAMIHYRESFSTNAGMNMFRGFLNGIFISSTPWMAINENANFKHERGHIVKFGYWANRIYDRKIFRRNMV